MPKLFEHDESTLIVRVQCACRPEVGSRAAHRILEGASSYGRAYTTQDATLGHNQGFESREHIERSG